MSVGGEGFGGIGLGGKRSCQVRNTNEFWRTFIPNSLWAPSMSLLIKVAQRPRTGNVGQVTNYGNLND